MAKNLYQGDPKLFLSQEGAYLKFINGQPIMDAGLENHVTIPLFTRRRAKVDQKSWVGNLAFDNVEHHLGTDFLEGAEAPITVGSLEVDQKNAEKALQSLIDTNLASEIIVTVTNPSGYRKDMRVVIRPPNVPESELVLIRNGLNWVVQGDDPAGGGEIVPPDPVEIPYGYGNFEYGEKSYGIGE
jgi:phage gp46-like protein